METNMSPNTWSERQSRHPLSIAIGTAWLLAFTATGLQAQDEPLAALPLQPLSIIGTPEDAAQITGGATVITDEELERLNYTDIQRILRLVPGVAIQVEDGFGLRPNISIRGTATDRSARITLMEDGVLIAPAPYAAPAAYYFPNAGRIHQVEVLKGPAAITQGPYTVGGALNLLSTPIPDRDGGMLEIEGGPDATFRGHFHYGGGNENWSYVVETLQWYSDGFQDIDRSSRDAGFDIQDYMAKLRYNTDRNADGPYQQVELKLQYAEQDSNFSYLGLTDVDFRADPLRRYGLSELDNIQTEHWQVQLNYQIEFNDDWALQLTGYNNDFRRNWFKTEGIDVDGSANAEEFDRTSWFNVIDALNNGEGIGELSAADLQAILDGSQDTAAGAIQLRANNREYYSRGVQTQLAGNFATGSVAHELTVGLRFHSDQEDRLQRNSTYTQINGSLVLDDLGRLGNAGNRIQNADAFSAFIYDRISIGRLTLTPGLRLESIDQDRIRFETRPDRTDNLASRADDNIRDTRQNNTDSLLAGIGALYQFSDSLSGVLGVHEGFSAPSNAPGVRPESSINYEYGLRFNNGWLQAEAIGFFTDYDNLVGVCTNSSGADCNPGDAFNGEAASVLGLEFLLQTDISPWIGYGMPLRFNYTFIDAEFDTDIADTEFFGDVSKGDPLPFIPEHQFNAQLGFEATRWATYINATFVDNVCTRSPCSEFLVTDSTFTVDLSAQYDLSNDLQLYTRVENLFDENALLGRQPYGARPNKDRTFALGVRLAL